MKNFLNIKHTEYLTVIFYIFFSFIFTSQASATIVGDEITATSDNFIAVAIIDPIIGDGSEFSHIHGGLEFDFYEGILDIISINGVGWGNWGSVTFTGFTDIITDFSFLGGAINGDPRTLFGFTSDSLTITLGDGSSGALGVIASYAIGTTSVPEPSAIALMGLGLLGFVATRRRRQN